ncbi:MULTISPECIES: hypothetical protein [unclassified Bradyrhizobium]|uniref:hypothetical protein n=1 Tax=unclassified Bradyrhizobium TaxID=2631580 RepID=UPI001CD4DBCB|nr:MULTISPECIES: hypothetical protein [unclassified Bradyrhizobium]
MARRFIVHKVAGKPGPDDLIHSDRRRIGPVGHLQVGIIIRKQDARDKRETKRVCTEVAMMTVHDDRVTVLDQNRSLPTFLLPDYIRQFTRIFNVDLLCRSQLPDRQFDYGVIRYGIGRCAHSFVPDSLYTLRIQTTEMHQQLATKARL